MGKGKAVFLTAEANMEYFLKILHSGERHDTSVCITCLTRVNLLHVHWFARQDGRQHAVQLDMKYENEILFIYFFIYFFRRWLLTGLAYTKTLSGVINIHRYGDGQFFLS